MTAAFGDGGEVYWLIVASASVGVTEPGSPHLLLAGGLILFFVTAWRRREI